MLRRINNISFFYTPIKGWMAPIELGYLYDKVYNLKENDIVVEVGCYRGRSSFAIATAIKDSGKNINLFCVDSFLWSEDQYDIFVNNMKDFNIKVLRSESVIAAKQFKDESISFLFLDADHYYKAVILDIEAWLPKIKIGGIFAGHDYTKGYQGVIPAVKEKFGNIKESPISIWEHQKNGRE
jgi:predicted O-methyltransferase YrrM